MKTNNHCFTRDGITYDCYAYNKSAKRSAGDGIRRWFVTAQGREVAAFPWDGNELHGADAVRRFEDRVVAFISGTDPG